MAGFRKALLVATSRYIDPGLHGLRAPAGEAEELKQVLKTQGGFEPVEVLRNESKRQIESEIEKLLQGAGPDDLVLLYLSCHGIKNDHGQLLFAACNTELSHVESSAISSVFVQQQLHMSQAGMKVVLLDCCYSGAFSHGLVPKSVEQIDLGQLVGRGTYVMTATSAVEYAYEGDEFTASDPVPSSLFTRAVLKGIRTGEADADGDGLITGDELYNYVFRELEGQRQTPNRDTQMAGPVIIARAPSTPPEELGQPEQAEAAPAALGPLLARATRTNHPTGSTLNVVVGSRSAGASWEPFRLSLAEPDNHLAVVGPTQSGKSQFLRTALLGLAADSEPEEVRIVIIDSESRFGAFERLPHVHAVLGPDQGDEIRELLTEVDRSISSRRAMFRKHAFESLAEFRVARRNRELPDDDPQQDVFLVFDRWEAFVDENPALAERVERIADKGTSFGVHVVVAARSWSRISGGMREHLRGHVELAGWSSEAMSHAGVFRVAIPNATGSEAMYDDMVSMIDGIAQRTRLRRTGWKFDLERIVGIDPASFDPPSAWRTKADPDHLRIPIGLDEFGRDVHLDLRSEAEGGMGPHGMIVGAHGTGVTQTLSSFLLLLMLTHSPSEVHVALLRGGLPYWAYRNLDQMPHVVSYMDETSQAETEKAFGRRLKDIRSEVLHRRNQSGRAAEMPRLVVAISKFDEVLEGRPDLVEQLREVMALGADVGVHVILLKHYPAYQFPAIYALCRFRIGTPAAAALNVDDPESGYVKERGKPPIKFHVWSPSEDSWADLVERVNQEVSEKAPELRSPLAQVIVLGDVLGEPVRTERGLLAVNHEGRSESPIGILDRAEGADSETFLISANGSTAIRGEPYTGKADLTRTIVLALALTRSPEDMQFYFIGRGDGFSCGAVLSELPHVGASATARDEELCMAITQFLRDLLAERKAHPSGTFSTVFLVVEQWASLRHNFPGLIQEVRELARDGAEQGVHVIVSADSWSDKDQDWLERCPTRLELGGVTTGTGTVAGRAFRAAQPWLHLDDALEPPFENTRALARRIASAWSGELAPGPALPPQVVDYAEIVDNENPHVVLGMSSTSQLAELDLQRHPHLLCLGGPGSGKRNLLRVVITELNRLYSADEYEIIVLDPKRGLLHDAVGPQFVYLAVHGKIERILGEIASRIEQRLARRRSDAAEQPRKVFVIIDSCELIGATSSSDHPNLLQHYANLLARGNEVGVHLIVTRNSINIGDALTTGFLGRLRAAGCATVVLGGDARDGELLPGIRSVPRPPRRGSYVRDGKVETIQVAHLPAKR